MCLLFESGTTPADLNNKNNKQSCIYQKNVVPLQPKMLENRTKYHHNTLEKRTKRRQNMLEKRTKCRKNTLEK